MSKTLKGVFRKLAGLVMTSVVLLNVCSPSNFIASASSAYVPVSTLETAKKSDSLSILLVGNSFSVDSSEYLYDVATASGYTNVTVGNCYKGGITIEDYVNYLNKNSAVFTYRRTSNGSWTTYSSKKLTYALSNKNWDVIIFQQYSSKAGITSSFYEDGDTDSDTNYIDTLVSAARTYCKNSEVKVGWEMTWAYPASNTSSDFKKYFGSSQTKMYKAICETTQSVVASRDGSDGKQKIDFIVQTGTAVQNARSSYMGDTLNRDDKHLSYDVGRYLAAMTIASSCGVNLDNLSTLDTNVDDYSTLHLDLLKKCVADSEEYPYTITSQTTTTPTLEKPAITVTTSSKKRQITWEAVEGATGYILKQRKSGTDSYSTVKTLSSNKTSYTITDVPNNTVYYYRVYAVGDDYISNTYSNTAYTCYVTAPGSPALKSSTSKKMTLSWNKNSSASGYQIDYSTSSNYSNRKRITCSKTTSSKTISGLTSNKTYYVRIRAYKTVANHTYYSGWKKLSVTIQ